LLEPALLLQALVSAADEAGQPMCVDIVVVDQQKVIDTIRLHSGS